MSKEAGKKKISKGGTWGLTATLAIIFLILGYIPLSSLILKGMVVDYTLNLSQYDQPGAKASVPRQVDLVRVEGENAFVVGSLPLEKRYTEMYLDTRGTQTSRLDFGGEFLGDPSQLWLKVSSPTGGERRYPLYLKGLEGEGWNKLSSGEFTLYQKGERFTDMEEFFRYAAGTDESIGLAGCDPDEVLALGSEAKDVSMHEQLEMPLRGQHACQLLVENGRLEVDISKRDLNLTDGADFTSLKVFKENEVVYTGLMPDDGDEVADKQVSADETGERIVLDGIRNGLYRLEIGSANDGRDYIITKFVTNATRTNFVNRVFLFDPGEVISGMGNSFSQVPLYLQSPGGTLTASTWHALRDRSISLDGRGVIQLNQSDNDNLIVSGRAEVRKGDLTLGLTNPGSLILEMDGGGFSFLPQNVFDPNLTQLRQLWTGDVDNYSLILTKGYTPPVITEGKIICEEAVDLKAEGITGSKLKMLVEKKGEEAVVASLRIRLE